ncbi:MAG: hypothetical protein LBE31_11990 [Deltaproteobacteria bacterium]|nr:hypothetical protein [Deltaproteobacteria bacterium]
MKRIPIDKVIAGQMLAEKLTRHDGVLLASQGTPITEGLLRMLGRMNIDSVLIEEDESRTPQEVMEDFRQFAAELEARFVRIEPQSVLQALKKTMLYLAEKERDETLALINNPAPPPEGDKQDAVGTEQPNNGQSASHTR